MISNNTYHRKNSLRLSGYDYSTEGNYFITILTKNRAPYFGELAHDAIVLSKTGYIIKEEWERTPQIRDEVEIGSYVIMPDHFHALLSLNTTPVKAHGHARLLVGGYKNKFGPQSKNLSALVRAFKGSCTRRIRELVNPEFSWHRGFHDRIVRNQKELDRIDEYICSNPERLMLKNTFPDLVL